MVRDRPQQRDGDISQGGRLSAALADGQEDDADEVRPYIRQPIQGTLAICLS